MKKMLKLCVTTILSFLARRVIRRYKPHIVMVTGSVGKTSTKDAIATVLSSRFLVRKSEKSFNSEWGVPFTIFGVKNPWHEPRAWFRLFKQAFGLVLLPNHYPKMLVLEVGADAPGDLARILRIATPDAVVVTRLPDIPVHVEAYTSPESVRDEEFSPAYALRVASPLIISADDVYALENAKRIPARVISYGLDKSAKVRIGNVSFAEKNGTVIGMQATIADGENTSECVVPGAVGTTQLFPLAAAFATARAFGIPFSEAVTALDSYVPPPGRDKLLQGIHGSILLDDSYNSSPIAVERALETLSSFPNATRRIAVLGDMLELGRYSIPEHERIAKLAQASADLIFAVGIRSRVFATAKGSAEVQLFDTSEDARRAVQEMIQKGDVILIKGSQSMRMERVVKALLKDPADEKLLVRQSKKWLSIK